MIAEHFRTHGGISPFVTHIYSNRHVHSTPLNSRFSLPPMLTIVHASRTLSPIPTSGAARVEFDFGISEHVISFKHAHNSGRLAAALYNGVYLHVCYSELVFHLHVCTSTAFRLIFVELDSAASLLGSLLGFTFFVLRGARHCLALPFSCCHCVALLMRL